MIHNCSECKKDYDDGWGVVRVVQPRRICNTCLTRFRQPDQSDFLDGIENVLQSEFERAFGKVNK